MSLVSRLAVGGALAVSAASGSVVHFRSSSPHVAVSREVIAVYLGTEGTDSLTSADSTIATMRNALARQSAATGRRLVVRGVSLEPTVDGGLRHLGRLGRFDEISVGGNWTNSSVIRYLGGTIGQTRETAIPQVVLFEREIRQEASTLQVSSEREIGRYVGHDEIGRWVREGAPVPR